MWVEALVPGEDAGTLVWLQLDPTPSLAAVEDSGSPLLRWLWNRVMNPDYLWKSLIMDYNPDRQVEVSEQLTSLFRGGSNDAGSSTGNVPWLLLRGTAAVAIVAALAFAGFWVRRRWFAGGAAGRKLALLPCYGRLLQVLERCCQLRPGLGQTPLEFAVDAQGVIAGRLVPVPAATSLAELPRRIVDLLYRIRFGGQTHLDGECQALAATVAELENALRTAIHK